MMTIRTQPVKATPAIPTTTYTCEDNNNKTTYTCEDNNDKKLSTTTSDMLLDRWLPTRGRKVHEDS